MTAAPANPTTRHRGLPAPRDVRCGPATSGESGSFSFADSASVASAEPAMRADVPGIVGLLHRARSSVSPQTMWNVPWDWARYRVVRDADREVIAAGALVRPDPWRYELRGIAVDPRHRGLGLASLVVSDLLRISDADGRETVCVTRTPRFFARFGFHAASSDWIPELRAGPGGLPSSTDSARIAMARPPRSLTP